MTEKKLFLVGLLAALFGLSVVMQAAASRIKDIAYLEGVRENRKLNIFMFWNVGQTKQAITVGSEKL